jgi:hypothetical protein
MQIKSFENINIYTIFGNDEINQIILYKSENTVLIARW